jgi:hypothetical protein
MWEEQVVLEDDADRPLLRRCRIEQYAAQPDVAAA